VRAALQNAAQKYAHAARAAHLFCTACAFAALHAQPPRAPPRLRHAHRMAARRGARTARYAPTERTLRMLAPARLRREEGGRTSSEKKAEGGGDSGGRARRRRRQMAWRFMPRAGGRREQRRTATHCTLSRCCALFCAPSLLEKKTFMFCEQKKKKNIAGGASFGRRANDAHGREKAGGRADGKDGRATSAGKPLA